MRIPLGDNTIGYVGESEYICYVDDIKCRGAYFSTNDLYENNKSYIKMSYLQFKQKYPIASNRYNWHRYIERKYN